MAKDSEATLLVRIKQVGQNVLDRLVFTFGDLVNLAKSLASALVKPIEAFREQEKATNALNTSMVNAGVYTKALSNNYAEMAKELQKVTTYADEQITAAQGVLQAQIGQMEITPRLTEAVLDLATAQGIDLNRAAEMVGKSINSSTNALAREGVAVDVTASKQERLTQVLDGIEKKWHGQARAAADGLGVLDQLKVSVGDLYETLGERLAPVIVTVATSLKNLANDTKTTGPILDGLVQVFAFIVKMGDYVIEAFQGVGTSIGAFLGTTAVALQQAVNGQFKQAWETMKSGSEAAEAEVTAIKKRHAEFRASIDDARLQQQADTFVKETDLIKQSNANKQALSTQQAAIDQANAALKNEQEILDTQLHLDELNNLTLTAQLERINAMLLQDQTATMQMALEQKKRVILTRLNNEELKRAEENLFQFRQAKRQAELQNQNTFFSTVSSLSSAKSKELAAIGKAAAITQIAIQTPKAVASSYAFGASIGGPILAAVFAGIAGTAMAAQAAQVAGIPLAEGGIVRATPGGVNAVIGEGGRDEAVIPLDSPDAAGRLGGGMTINFNGPVMGDANQAREFARALDREFYNLRRDGESVAFDERLG